MRLVFNEGWSKYSRLKLCFAWMGFGKLYFSMGWRGGVLRVWTKKFLPHWEIVKRDAG